MASAGSDGKTLAVDGFHKPETQKQRRKHANTGVKGMDETFTWTPTLIWAIFSYLLKQAALSHGSVTAPHVFVDPLRVAGLEIQFWWASKSQQNKYSNK